MGQLLLMQITNLVTNNYLGNIFPYKRQPFSEKKLHKKNQWHFACTRALGILIAFLKLNIKQPV